MKKLAFILALCFAAVGVAQVQQLDLNVSQRLAAITGGILIAPTSLLTSNDKINASKITRSLGASATVDFSGAASGCTDSSAITVTGARAGDTCELGAPISIATADAGAEASFSCFVSASDAVKVRFCTNSFEDPASETYRVRVFSNQ